MSRMLFFLLITLTCGVPLFVAMVNLLGIVGKELWMAAAFCVSFAGAGVFSWRITGRFKESRGGPAVPHRAPGKEEPADQFGQE
jgi:hypothetical protein